MSAPKSKCVVTPVDKNSSIGRDPFAPPAVTGNRWMKFGCDGAIPKVHRPKMMKAAELAYSLVKKKAFTDDFDDAVAKLANGSKMTFLDALDKIELNLAETSRRPEVQEEVKNSIEAKKKDRAYQVEGGFTLVGTGYVFIREFAIKKWKDTHLASLICHEAAHVAGVPGTLLHELYLTKLYRNGYPQPAVK